MAPHEAQAALASPPSPQLRCGETAFNPPSRRSAAEALVVGAFDDVGHRFDDHRIELRAPVADELFERGAR